GSGEARERLGEGPSGERSEGHGRRLRLRLGERDSVAAGGEGRVRMRLLGPKGQLVRAFGTTPIDEIRRSDLAEWWHAEIESKPRPVKIRRAERKEGSPPPAPRIGLSEKTGKNYLDALGAAFALAVEREWLEANPLDAFRASRRRRGRTARRRADTDPGRHVRPLPTPEAIDAFVLASRAEGGPLATVDLLLLDVGLRLGEAAALE